VMGFGWKWAREFGN